MFASSSSAARAIICAPQLTQKITSRRRNGRKMSTKINGFMTLRSEPDAPARSVTSDDVSSWPEIERQLVKACAIFAGDSSVNGRMQAAGQLGPHTTHDAVSEMSVVEVFTTAYEGVWKIAARFWTCTIDCWVRSFPLTFIFILKSNARTYLTLPHLYSRNAHSRKHGVSRARVREICGVTTEITQIQFARHGGVRRSRIVAHERRVRDDERGVERSRESGDADEGALMEFKRTTRC